MPWHYPRMLRGVGANLCWCVPGSNLVMVSADLDGIGDELGGLLLSQSGHVLQQDGDLQQGKGKIYDVHTTVRQTVCACHSYLTTAWVYLYCSTNERTKTNPYLMRCDINQAGGVYTAWECDLQWSPSGRCCCRSKASSLTDRGGPAAGCPSAEHRSSLGTEKGEWGQPTMTTHPRAWLEPGINSNNSRKLILQWELLLSVCVLFQHWPTSYSYR